MNNFYGDRRKALHVSPVHDERARQLAKWGLQKHTLRGWLSILKEEVAELECAMEMVDEGYDNIADVREEAIHAATVALVILSLKKERSHVRP